MFSRTQDDHRTTTTGRSGQVSVLAPDLTVTGVIASEGTIELHGTVDGELAAAAVTIGGDGRMKGKVQAGQVEVLGAMEGTIACGTLTLRAAARLKADCQSNRLIIESGAEVEGHFSRPPPPPAPPSAPAASAETTGTPVTKTTEKVTDKATDKADGRPAEKTRTATDKSGAD